MNVPTLHVELARAESGTVRDTQIGAAAATPTNNIIANKIRAFTSAHGSP
ncbi:MAG TPA: hypothetical protein VFI95_08470 [Terriglobales bacterium]|nr:hypothetical protein [Terriglobales bacterium]